jgi:hypothetical protein
MQITLALSPEIQAELERRAAATGTDVGGYVLDVVERQLEAGDNGAAEPPAAYEQWQCDFQAWIASHRSRNPDFDDSRESIYE